MARLCAIGYSSSYIWDQIHIANVPSSRSMARLVRGVLRAWESIQVELKGQYSPERLQQLLHYVQAASFLQACVVILLTPIPCIAIIILTDMLPLEPTANGLERQTYTYWARCFISAAIVTTTVMTQFYHSAPGLPRITWRWWATATVTSVGTTLGIAFLNVVVGFPTPFLFQSVSLIWQGFLFGGMWLLWRHTIRYDVNVRQNLQQYLWLFGSQVAMITLYPLLGYIFRLLSGQSQTWFSMSFPVLKLVLKNWASHGAFLMEDLAPCYVVFSVDVFHTLFLSSAVQSSTSVGTLLVVIAVDLGQSCVAVMEIFQILKRLQALERKLNRKNGSSAISGSILERANLVLNSVDVVRLHPQVAQPRHLRALRGRSQRLFGTVRRMSAFVTARQPTVKVFVSSACPNNDRPLPTSDERPMAQLNASDHIHLESVRYVLRLLHMVEFYVIVEFTELIMTIVYSCYLAAMTRLTNRAYYVQLQTMSENQLSSTMEFVLKFAALELFSFVALVLIFDALLRFSALRLLAFVLRSHWQVVQSLLVLWVFFVIQMSLQHFGNDYTFRFDWLSSIANSP